jgi:hypothetical protein
MHQLQVKAYVIQGGRPGLPLSLGPSRIGFSTEIWEAMKQCWSVDCALRTQGMNNLLRVVELVSWSQKGNYSRFRKVRVMLSGDVGIDRLRRLRNASLAMFLLHPGGCMMVPAKLRFGNSRPLRFMTTVLTSNPGECLCSIAVWKRSQNLL